MDDSTSTGAVQRRNDTLSSLAYPLRDGYVHNWLAAGPVAVQVPEPELERFQGDDFKLQILRHYFEPASGIAETPVENAGLSASGRQHAWRYVATADDHFVDLTAFFHLCHYLRAWAYTRVVSPVARAVTLETTTNGPADVWLNGEHVHRQEHLYLQIPHSERCTASLRAGVNDVLVRFENVATRACPFALALRILDQATGLPLGATVELPAATPDPARRVEVEGAVEAAYLDRDVFTGSDAVMLRWPDDLAGELDLRMRLQTAAGALYRESEQRVSAGASLELSPAGALGAGSYQVLVTPLAGEAATASANLARKIAFTVVRNDYAREPYGTMELRRREALEHAAAVCDNIFGQIARMALGRWGDVQPDVIRESIEGINRRKDCSDFWLCGLLGMMYRFGGDPAFPASLQRPLQDCVLNFKYWIDEPGGDAMCYWTENHQMLFHTCEVLAGQMFPDALFSNVGQNGLWHQQMGERRAGEWLSRRAAGGFREWDSNCYFEEDLLALSHLCDLAATPAVAAGAEAIMSKLLFTIAVNSYKGAFGSTHGRSYAPLIKGARLEGTSGTGRLMWGMGSFNGRILALTSLACTRGYRLPAVIERIAADLPDEMWQREHHAGIVDMPQDVHNGPWDVNKVTYKTPDYMLSSAQDWFPGRRGFQQHLWQATLSQDAVVFVSQPPCLSEEGSHRPNFWHGNVTLPRVAQWKETLIAVHNSADDDWLRFTHAYFPLYAFDEHVLHDGWAFARVGNGYVALTARQGITLVTRGDNAYRELRSPGKQNVWLCQMGRRALDGSFGQFQAKILAGRPHFDEQTVRMTTLRGDDLAFGWQGPLLLNGNEQAIAGFRHYDGPYCTAELSAPEMVIAHGEEKIRLLF